MAQDSTVLNELVRAKDKIKRKYEELKKGEADVHSLVSQTFKPIIDPLNKISSAAAAAVEIPPINTKVEIPPSHTNENFHFDIQNWLQSSGRDKLYGPKKINNGTIKLGNKEIEFTTSSIIIDKTPYELTSGLLYLIFSKHPKLYTEQDLKTYGEILTQTSAHLNSDGITIKSGGKKYKNVIKKLFSSGGGVSVSLQKHNYIYWNDANELVNRLRLLLASRSAGNTGVSNEILSIFEELYEAGVIKRIPNHV